MSKKLNIDNVDLHLVYLDADKVMMGSPQKEWMHNDNEPYYRGHYLDGFWISNLEVSNELFYLFINDGGYLDDKYWKFSYDVQSIRSRGSPKYWKGLNAKFDFDNKHPVVGVSFFEAVAFCKWLEKKTSFPFSLPTEQQWEYAAEGFTDVGDSILFPWGDEGQIGLGDIEDWKMSNTGFDAGTDKYEGVSPCGAMTSDVSWCGCFDMAGNVREWCLLSYLDGAKYNFERRSLSFPIRGTLKGGSYANGNDRFNLVSVFRNSGRTIKKANYSSLTIGFRIVINADDVRVTESPSVLYPN